MSGLNKQEDTTEVYIYKDTVNHKYNGDDNLCLIVLPTEYVKKYATENSEYSSFEEWLEGYTCDETEDLYDKVIQDGVNYELKDYRWNVCQEQQ